MSEQSTAQTSSPPPWRAVVDLARRAPDLTALIAMAVVGLAISAYLTTVHYAGVRLVCTAGGPVNCAAVTSSAYSVVPHTSLPITIPGMLWFLVSGGLAVVALLRLQAGRPEPERLRLVHFAWAALGLVFVLYLVYAEFVLVHRICEWCTAVHILTFATFLIAMARLQQLPDAASQTASAHVTARPGGRGMPARAPASSSARRAAVSGRGASRRRR